MIFFKIMGLILLILLAILLIGITIKIGIQVLWKEKGFILKIRYGIFSFQLIPWKGKKILKKKKDKLKPKKKKSEIKKLHPENLDLSETIEFLIHFMEELKNTITIERLYLELVVAGRDAAKTAILYGKIWEAIGLLDPVLDRCFKIQDKKIQVYCNFDEKKIRPNIEIFLNTRMIRTLRILWKERKKLWTIYRKLTKEEEVTHA